MTEIMDGEAHRGANARDGNEHERVELTPWDRYGWVMAVIWLFFLVFPVVYLLERPLGPRVWGLFCVGVFAFVYTFGFVRFPRIVPSQRTQDLTLVSLVVTGLAGAIAAGAAALTFVPFITAFGIYFQPVRRAIALSVLWVVFTPVMVTLTGTWSTLGIVVAIVALVGIATFIPRWLDDQQKAFTALESQYLLIAEQERVARDVHDVLGHSLTVIAMKAELAGRLLERESGASVAGSPGAGGAAGEIEAIESLARQALSEIRATVAGLRVARLDEELANARGVLADADVELIVAGDAEDLDPRYRLVAGWVVREAVTNIVRHAAAGKCRIEIGANGIVISDDGAGIDSAVADGTASEVKVTGVQGLRERVQQSGGTFAICAVDAGGTRVEAHW
ncbi:MAG TPA: histidine kinase [Actinomycetales bacterium]|nr:histidine kinase [Actinomycetales bacterium]